MLPTFPRTKCLPPTTHAPVVRAALVARLATQVEAHRVVLLSAPAGAGKTSLLAALVPALQRRQVAWLTLDADDHDPKRFLAGVAAAFQAITPDFGAHLLTLLAELPGDLPPRHLVATFINELLVGVTEPFAVIVDDLHHVPDSAVMDTLDYLIEHLPASGRLVLAARFDPPLSLARLRARGQLAELRYDALRFTLDETRRLVETQVPARVSDDTLALIHQRTEGWPAGLRLIALSLAQHTLAQRIDALLPHGPVQQHIFDLFAEEVLHQQEPEVQRFLLETSILDELTPQLCQAVTERTDAGRLLERLHRRDLFVVVLDPVTPSYRYHALFRSFLQQHLVRTAPDALRVLHYRAGLAAGDGARAVQHLLAAEAWEEAATRIEAAAMELYWRGHDLPQRWHDALPASLVAQRAPLSFVGGIQAAEHGDFARARQSLQRAVDLYSAAGDVAMQGEALTHLAAVSMRSYAAGGFDRVLQLCDAALALPLSRTAQARAHLGRVWSAFYTEDETAVDAGLEAVLDLLDAGDDRVLARQILSSVNLVLLPALRRRDILTRVVDTLQTRYGDGTGRLQVAVWSLVAGLHHLEGRLPEAHAAASHAARLMEQTGELVYVGLATDLLLAMLALARADWRANETLFARRYPTVSSRQNDGDTRAFSLLYLAVARFSAGDYDGVEQLARLVRTAAAPALRPAHSATIAQLEALAALARGDAAAAVRRLQPIAAHPPTLLERGLAPDARWLLGYAQLRHRQDHDALATIMPALAQAHERGWAGLPLRHGQLLVPLLKLAMHRNCYPITAQQALARLEAYAKPAPVPLPDSNESISPRELDVLRMLVDGASNQAVADALSISVWTVKSHVTSLLAKLGATSRTQAAARARELRIL